MKDIIKIIETLRSDRKLNNTLWFLTLCTAALILVFAFKDTENTGKFIVDESGKIIGIQRKSLKRTEEYSLRLKIQGENKEEERDLIIRMHPVTRKPKGEDQENGKKETDMNIRSIVNEIEFSDKKEIALPGRTPDGALLIWENREKRNIPSFMIIPLIYIFLVALLIKDVMDKERNEKTVIQNAVLKDLPRFCNQLLLMMNAGMILNDTVEQISKSYEAYDEKERSFFENELIKIIRLNRDKRNSMATVMTEFASQYNVKELIRIAVILSENEKRGSDVIENLGRESRYLWDSRKIIAKERGKLIDTRMTYPMGLLLILLIVITITPALLNI